MQERIRLAAYDKAQKEFLKLNMENRQTINRLIAETLEEQQSQHLSRRGFRESTFDILD